MNVAPIDFEAAAQNMNSRPSSPERRPWRTPAERAATLGGALVRIPTGLPTLDKATRGGPQAGRVVIFGGAPGAGKTTLACDLAHGLARRGVPIAILAADEDADGLLVRFGQREGFAREQLEEGDPVTRERFAERVGALPLLLVDADEDNALVEDLVEEFVQRHPAGPRVLIVDSIQTVRCSGSADADGPRARIDLVIGALKRAAKAHGLLVIATCELARGAYRSKNAADQIDDLAAFKESGGIEYGAALLLVLRSVADSPGMVDVSMPKNRMGQKLPFRLALDFARASFSEVQVEAKEAERPGAQHEGVKRKVREYIGPNPDVPGADVLGRKLGLRLADVRAAVKDMLATSELVNAGTPNRPRLRLQHVGANDHE